MKNGDKWSPHPEDEGHWPHWDQQPCDGGKKKRHPQKSKKPWPNQKKPPYGDQSETDPNIPVSTPPTILTILLLMSYFLSGAGA